jgi:cell division protein FtsN
MKSDTGQEKYAVVVGGLLNRGEAEPLQQRLLAKGIKSALVRVEK